LQVDDTNYAFRGQCWWADWSCAASLLLGMPKKNSCAMTLIKAGLRARQGTVGALIYTGAPALRGIQRHIAFEPLGRREGKGNVIQLDGESSRDSPAPPVLIQMSWLQPLLGCDEFHDAVTATDWRSECDERDASSPCVLSSSLQVWSAQSINALPSGCEPVNMSCRLGLSPTPLVIIRRSHSEPGLLLNQILPRRASSMYHSADRRIWSLSCSLAFVPGTCRDAVPAFTAGGRSEPACLGKLCKV